MTDQTNPEDLEAVLAMKDADEAEPDFANLGLTDDERSALASGDEDETDVSDAADGDDDDEIEAVQAKADDEGDETEEEGEGEEDGQEAKADDADPDADDKPAEAVEAKPEPNAPRQVVPKWAAPENAEARLNELSGARDAVVDRFESGEITQKEMLSELAALNKEERKIERAIDRAEMAVEMAHNLWTESTVPAFLEANPHYRANPTLLAALDAEVRRQQVAASEAGQNHLDPSILAKADKALQDAISAMTGAKPKPAAQAAPAASESPQKVKPKAGKPAIPPTLANVPASDINGTDDKYSVLDRMADANPLAFEDALAKMPEHEREAYLARH